MAVRTTNRRNVSDELAGFEEAWQGSGRGSSPGWSHDYDLQQKAGKLQLAGNNGLSQEPLDGHFMQALIQFTKCYSLCSLILC